MADTQFVTENRLRQKANAGRDTQRKVALMIGLPLVVVVGAMTNPMFAGGALVTVALWYLLASGDAITLAGAAGEDIALDHLKQLSDDYKIFNQLEIPNERSRTGFNEADIVLLGPKCIFIIEVKHNNSVVAGAETAREWEARKVGRGGTPYTSRLRNPIAQTKKLVWLLSEELKKRGTPLWIQGVVVFTHPNAEVHLDGASSLPVLKLDELVSYITGYAGTDKKQAAQLADISLSALKTGS